MKPKKKFSVDRQAVLPPSHPSLHWADILTTASAVFLGLTLFLTPLFPDEKLNRLKLMVLGGGLLLALLAWALSRALEQKSIVHRTPLDPFLALYALSAVLFYRFSADPAVAASEFQRMVFSVGAFWTALQICSGEQGRKARTWAVSGWMSGLALISVYGLLQVTGGVGRLAVPKMDRVFASFGNTIFFAVFLINSIPVALALAWGANGFKKIVLWVVTALALAALWHTQTRAAFLALPFSLALWALLAEWRGGWTWTQTLWGERKKVLIGLACLLALHGLVSVVSGRYREVNVRAWNAVRSSRATATEQTHTLIWKDVVKMWRAHPWLGTGYGTFHLEFPQYASEELKRVFPQRERIVNDAHNEYLQILAETGLIGFLIFGAVIAVFYVWALRAFWTRTGLGFSTPVDSALFGGLLAGTTAALAQNFFSVDMRFIVSSAYAFLTMGLAASFGAKPVEFAWPVGSLGKAARILWSAVFLLAVGVVGIRPGAGELYLAGIYRIGTDAQGRWTLTETPASGPGLLPALLRPYLSQRVVNRTPDFFDEKSLNAAQNISQMEALVKQYPQQWKYWEKLGFMLAREIQSKDAGGRKVINPDMARRSIEAYRKAVELNPSAEGPLNNLGNIYYTLNYRADAIPWWQKVIEINPDNLDARINLGIAFYYEGRIKESARQFQEVLKRDPRNDKAIVMLKRMVE